LPHAAKETPANILAHVQLSGRFRVWIGYQSPQFQIFGYGLDMEFMKTFWIQSDCKISTSVYHCKIYTNQR